MTKQDLIYLQELIDAAQTALNRAVEAVHDLVEDTDDDDEKEGLEALLYDLDTQLPAVGDYFPPKEPKP